jgi:hypothetical protein
LLPDPVCKLQDLRGIELTRQPKRYFYSQQHCVFGGRPQAIWVGAVRGLLTDQHFLLGRTGGDMNSSPCLDYVSRLIEFILIFAAILDRT